MTHKPTGIVVYCDETRSQGENRLLARAELERRLREKQQAAQAKKTNDTRKNQANSERSAKSFTWNMQRGTVVEHSTGQSWRLKDFARGKI